VKCTVLLDLETHARLAAAAAKRRCDRSALAAGFIREGLRGVVVFDRANPADHVDPATQGIGDASAA
jgi:hypothetical protein